MSKETKQWTLIFSLLAIVIILPAGAMLWFGSRAAVNEQMAIKQRLIDKYSNDVKSEIFVKLPEYIQSQMDTASEKYYEIFNPGNAVTAKDIQGFGTIFDELLLYGMCSLAEPYGVDNVQAVLPMQRVSLFQQLDDPVFNNAKTLEFVECDYSAAIEYYKKVSILNNTLNNAASVGIIRCLKKNGDYKAAIDVCLELYEFLRSEKAGAFEDKWRILLMLAGLYHDTGAAELSGILEQISDIASCQYDRSFKYFVLDRAIDYGTHSSVSELLLHKLLLERNHEKFIMDICNNQPEWLANYPWTSKIEGNYYWCVFSSNPQVGLVTLVGLLSEDKLSELFEKVVNDLSDDMVYVNILSSEDGANLVGEKVTTDIPDTIFTLPMTGIFKDHFSVHVAFRPDVFGRAVTVYRSAYLWSAFSIIVLVAAGVVIVWKMLLQQLKVNRLKNDFIATVSHELRTPLASTKVLVDTLIDGNYSDDNTLKEYLAIISSENERLSSLIDSFLTFSRMDRGKEVFDKSNTSVNTLLIGVDKLFEKKNEENCKFSVTILTDDATILMDERAMQTVLLNLLSNAYKYNKSKVRSIHLSAEKTGNSVIISVADNGIGLTAIQKRKIFERFYRVDNTLCRETEGTGIGLSIVKYILDAHGFSIEVKSRLDDGSVFRIKCK